MKQTIGQYEFTEAFRTTRPENFSYAGRIALFQYLEQYEEDTGDELEFDVVAICCDFTEYADLAEFQQAYSAEYESIEDIEQETTVIRVDDESFIIQNF